MKGQTIMDYFFSITNNHKNQMNQIVGKWYQETIDNKEQFELNFKNAEKKLPTDFLKEKDARTIKVFKDCKYHKETNEFKGYTDNGEFLKECQESLDNYSSYLDLIVDAFSHN